MRRRNEINAVKRTRSSFVAGRWIARADGKDADDARVADCCVRTRLRIRRGVRACLRVTPKPLQTAVAALDRKRSRFLDSHFPPGGRCTQSRLRPSVHSRLFSICNLLLIVLS
ncbi:hypothetical protein EVAR_52156_1 [Eumeta japonica]|uniref:Uncharacterized protein n=1 Tax=Eumeta variegata TaxID=151549 RepID=A0A4C1YDG2_EUMVA|nr:hypothetical protein EVAR_52156_1 [Eumeta japonica]